METWKVLSIVLSVIGMVGAVAIHMIKTSYWMGQLTETLRGVKDTIDKIEKRVSEFESNHFRKDDALRELGRMDLKIDSAHKRIDELIK